MIKNVVAKSELLDFNNSLKKGKGAILDGDISSSEPDSVRGNEESSFSSLLQEGLDNLRVDSKNDKPDADSPQPERLPESAAAERALPIDKKLNEVQMRIKEDELVAAGPSEKDTEVDALFSGVLIVSAGAALVDAGKNGSGYAEAEERVADAALVDAGKISSGYADAEERVADAALVDAGKISSGYADAEEQVADAAFVDAGKISSGYADAEERVSELKQSVNIVLKHTESEGSLNSDKNAGFTEVVSPPVEVPKGGPIIPVEESAGQVADSRISNANSVAIGNGAAGDSPELSAVIGSHTDALSGIITKDGTVDAKLPEVTGSVDSRAADSDLHAAVNTVEQLSGKIKGEVVQKEVSGRSDAEMTFYIDRGNSVPKGSGEPASAAVPEGNGASGAVQPQANIMKDPMSQKESEAPLWQIKTDFSAASKNGVGEEAVLPSTDAPKGKLNLSLEESAGKAAGNSNVDINSYNVGRQIFSANDSAPVEGRNLVDQVLSQLPEDALKGSNRVRLSLYPESLGKVDMDIVVRENRVHVFIMADRADVVQALHGQQEQLKNALQAQGLQVNNLDFQLRENPTPMDDGSRGGDLWRQGNQERGQKEGENDETSVMSGALGALTANILQIQTQERSISLFV